HTSFSRDWSSDVCSSDLEVMSARSPDIALDEAALLIAARLRPDLDIIEWLAALDMLAGECPTPTAMGVARFLFDIEHFVGDRNEIGRASCREGVSAARVA